MTEILFRSQPAGHQLGAVLLAELVSPKWSSLEIAVAWVRRSGTRHLKPAFQHFIEAGGTARFTVGVDIENTSREGLSDLLELRAAGDAETYVYHNEARPTFHPKVYLLQNDACARLIVGSNNMTEAGLFTNTEAALLLDAPNDHPVVRDVRTALASWRDPNRGFAKRLDPVLLDDLVTLGYVVLESSLGQRRRKSEDEGRARRPGGRQALFAGEAVAAPHTPAEVVSVERPATVLLMRVRRASETSRRTQAQIPFKVLRTEFFEGVDALVSARDGRSHPIITATARGGENTKKVELPEIDPLQDPVIRLTKTDPVVFYEAFDANSPPGIQIMEALRRGLAFSPPVTFLTLPRDPVHATWWRFV